MIYGPKQYYTTLALQAASQKDWDTVFQYLDTLEKRLLDPNCYSHNGRGFLDFAYDQENAKVVNRLIQQYKVYNSPYAQAFFAAEYGDWTCVLQLIARKTIHINSYNTRHVAKWTLLDYALTQNEKAVITELMKQGAIATIPITLDEVKAAPPVTYLAPTVIRPNTNPIGYVSFLNAILSRNASSSLPAAAAVSAITQEADEAGASRNISCHST